MIISGSCLIGLPSIWLIYLTMPFFFAPANITAADQIQWMCDYAIMTNSFFCNPMFCTFVGGLVMVVVILTSIAIPIAMLYVIWRLSAFVFEFGHDMIKNGRVSA